MRFSPYVQKCIEADLERGGSIEYIERERGSESSIAAEKPGTYNPGPAPRRKGRRKT